MDNKVLPVVGSPQHKAKIEKVDRAWLRAAMIFGLTMSQDPERRLGACVVSPDNLRVSFGYNGLPKCVPDTPENWGNKELKNALVCHAEPNAISNAPFDKCGSTCYVTLRPCHRCLGAIVNAQCKRVVWLDDPRIWKYYNEEAFQLILTSSQIEVVEYRYTPVEVGILELYGAIPDGFSQYGYATEEQ